MTEYIEVVEALLTKYFHDHGPKLAARNKVDCVVVVPSSERPPPHPLHEIIGGIGLEVPVLGLLCRGAGTLERVRATRDAFEVTTDLPMQRVLLVDDVYTTGSHINSAAATLRDAGHQISGAFVAARRVNPTYSPQADLFWQQRTATTFDWVNSPVVSQH